VDYEPDDKPIDLNPIINFTVRSEKTLTLPIGANLKVPTGTGGTPPLALFTGYEAFKVHFDENISTS